MSPTYKRLIKIYKPKSNNVAPGRSDGRFRRIWTAWAFVTLGQGNFAEELFRLLNPVYHADSPEKVMRYQVEPYVTAADVYSTPPHVGRGGWTWYTGSSGWMYRLGIEAILGIQRSGNVLHVNPCIPQQWSGFEVIYRVGLAQYHIYVKNPNHVSCGIAKTTVDGTVVPDGKILVSDDSQQHIISILMG